MVGLAARGQVIAQTAVMEASSRTARAEPRLPVGVMRLDSRGVTILVLMLSCMIRVPLAGEKKKHAAGEDAAAFSGFTMDPAAWPDGSLDGSMGAQQEALGQMEHPPPESAWHDGPDLRHAKGSQSRRKRAGAAGDAGKPAVAESSSMHAAEAFEAAEASIGSATFRAKAAVASGFAAASAASHRLSSDMEEAASKTSQQWDSSVRTSQSAARRGLAEAKEALDRKSEQVQHAVSHAVSESGAYHPQAGKSPGMSIQEKTLKSTEQMQQKMAQKTEQVQQQMAQKAVNNYVSHVSGGLVTSVPPGASNAALGYAKKNPQDAMKVAKFAAKMM
eukprot:gnl/TRDRNA2_/TRDRNA2_163417_c0_seq1.p1 gnl/TRDRNA2_/TRDRNA2_163417_c0~~gnl/TRDRNA2_/TRDRNA2_163417_c0_seq1.p1  ORF type:complete len:332 (+),score=69.34 gnl/TRDRNA2_/TRDRNA2_163417_c0_seq1:397-1392(+)